MEKVEVVIGSMISARVSSIAVCEERARSFLRSRLGS
jgi:hypothetical protein